MRRLISMMLGAVGLLALGGCASTEYFNMVRMEPEELPSVVTEDLCEIRRVQPCFTVTTRDFVALGYVATKGGPLCLPFWLPIFVPDIPVSLCTDIVTMPWQIARYRRFTSDDANVPRSEMVSELLRSLKEEQNATGQISAVGSDLANTALTVLALLHRGDLPGCNTEFSEMCGKGIDYLVSRADAGEAAIKLDDDDKKDPRVFLIAADALASAYGYTRREDFRELAEKCTARVVKEAVAMESESVLAAKLDEKKAEQFRWIVMALHDAKDAGLAVADLDARLECAKTMLARHGKGDNGYYDVWELHRKVFVDGTADAGAWTALLAARKDAVRKSLLVGGMVQDKEGKWRWRSTAHPRGGGIKESGLGYIADTALAVLQLDWSVFIRCPPKSGDVPEAKQQKF